MTFFELDFKYEIENYTLRIDYFPHRIEPIRIKPLEVINENDLWSFDDQRNLTLCVDDKLLICLNCRIQEMEFKEDSYAIKEISLVTDYIENLKNDFFIINRCNNNIRSFDGSVLPSKGCEIYQLKKPELNYVI